MSDPSSKSARKAPDLGVLGGFKAPDLEQLSQNLPEFEFIEVLGVGGMGAVYKARQPKLNRVVAVKILPPPEGPDEFNLTARFEREAQAMAQVNHPNIANLYDFGETESGMRYIVMEFIDGTDLHSAIQSGKLTTEHVMAWLPQICSALQYAHDQSLVHRDIKPANILITTEGQVKIVDLGLAKLVGEKADEMALLTIARNRLGTPDYAAPEMGDPRVEEVDHRGDVYSVGVVAYEMLTGRLPRGAWKAPSEMNSDVDRRFDELLAGALQANREKRYQSMGEIVAALNEIREHPNGTTLSNKPKTDSSSASRTPPQNKGAKKKKRVAKKATKKTTKSSGGMSAGVIVALVVGMILAVAAVIAAAMFLGSS